MLILEGAVPLDMSQEIHRWDLIWFALGPSQQDATLLAHMVPPLTTERVGNQVCRILTLAAVDPCGFLTLPRQG